MMVEMVSTIPGLSFSYSGFLIMDLSKPCKIPIVGIDSDGKQKEYFLKETERKGLVLV